MAVTRLFGTAACRIPSGTKIAQRRHASHRGNQPIYPAVQALRDFYGRLFWPISDDDLLY